jgi:hypothetical protein
MPTIYPGVCLVEGDLDKRQKRRLRRCIGLWKKHTKVAEQNAFLLHLGAFQAQAFELMEFATSVWSARGPSVAQMQKILFSTPGGSP